MGKDRFVNGIGVMVLITTLLLSPFVWAKDATVHSIVFDADGSMVSAPPQRIEGGDEIEFRVMRDMAQERQNITKVLDEYLAVMNELAKYIKNAGNIDQSNDNHDPEFSFYCESNETNNNGCDLKNLEYDPYAYFGIDKEDGVKSVYCKLFSSVQDLYNENKTIIENNSYYEGLLGNLRRVFSCSNGSNSSFKVPSASDLAQLRYSVNMKFLTENDVIVEEQKIDLFEQVGFELTSPVCINLGQKALKTCVIQLKTGTDVKRKQTILSMPIEIVGTYNGFITEMYVENRKLHACIRSNDNGIHMTIGSQPVVANRKYDIALYYPEQEFVMFYVNGKLVGSASEEVHCHEKIEIQKQNNNTNNKGFPVIMYGIQLWDRILSEKELAHVPYYRLTGDEQGLIAFIKGSRDASGKGKLEYSGNVCSDCNCNNTIINNEFIYASENYFSSQPIVIPDKCGKIDFELKLTNNKIATILEICNRNTTLSGLRGIQETLRAARKQIQPGEEPALVLDYWKEYVKPVENSLKKYRISRMESSTPTPTPMPTFPVPKEPSGFDIDRANKELEKQINILLEIKNTVQSKVKEHNSWIKEMVLFSKGKPSLNPLIDQLTLADLKKKIAEGKKTLLELTAKQEAFDKIALNQGFKLDRLSWNADEAAPPDPNTKKQSVNIVDELGPAAQNIKEKNTRTLEIAENEKKLAVLEEQNKTDTFLYRGSLIVTAGKPHIIMQNHDARNKFFIMGREYLSQIDEQSRLYVIIQNALSNLDMSAQTKITPIDKDESPITQDILLTQGPKPKDMKTMQMESKISVDQKNLNGCFESPIPPPPKKNECCKHIYFLKAYNRLAKELEFLNTQLDAPDFPLTLQADTTPKFVSYVVPMEPPQQAPAIVEYTLKAMEDKTEKEKWQGQYRYNKLYRFRLKTGLTYSNFKKDDFTTAQNDTTGLKKLKLDRSVYGTDISFGLQCFPFKKRNLYDRKYFYPVLYTGFSVREVMENVYLGAGFEPYSGITLLYGIQVGREDCLIKGRKGKLYVEDHWDHFEFFSILFDVQLFNLLFGL